MSIYSTNRVSSLTESQVDFSTPDFSVGDILESCIEIAENEHKMFNSVIECDFLEAANLLLEDGEAAEEKNEKNQEAKTTSFKQKLEIGVQKIIEAIKKAAANIIYKLNDLFKSDKKLVEQFGKNLTSANYSNFPGIADFAFPSKIVSLDDIKAEEAEKFTEDFLGKVEANPASALEELKKKSEERLTALDKLEEDNFGEKKEKWMPNKDDLKLAVDTLTDGKANVLIKSIKEKANNTIKTLEDVKRNSRASKKEEVAHAKYQGAMIACNTFSKEFKAYTNLVIKQVAACRKALILCGRYANKGASDKDGSKESDEKIEKVEGEIVESAIMYALAEASDAYVYESLAF